MKRIKYTYSVMQAITYDLNDKKEFVEVDQTNNSKIANKSFNVFKKIGDTQPNHTFYQTTRLVKYVPGWNPERVKVEVLREETRKFTGMKGEQIQ